jgi:hypothetical protein
MEAALLRRNLLALARAAPTVARRLAAVPPVDPFVPSPDGPAVLVRRAKMPVASPALPDAPPGLRLGIGAGEQVLADLSAPGGHPVTVWERDPRILTRFLAHHDVAAALATRRLRPLLGVDLLDQPPGPALPHPLFGALYRWEVRTWQRPAAPRALVVEGALLVDDLVEDLDARGYTPWTWEVELPPAYTEPEVARLRPALALCVNHVHGLPEAAARLGVPYRCWEIDPAVDRTRPAAAPLPQSRIFTWRSAHVPTFAALGYPAAHLPLAAAPRRRPVPPDPAFACALSFAGRSMVLESRRILARLEADLAPHRLDPRAALQAVLDAQRHSDAYILPALVAQALPELLHGRPYDPRHLLGEVAAARWRLDRVASLAPHGVDVWGDPGWREAPGVRYRGPLAHGDPLNALYCSSAVNLDIERLYQRDIVTLRVFDILACGGFVLAAHNDEIGQHFDLGREVVTWSGARDLQEKAAHYLAHPAEAQAIAARGRARVERDHRLRARVDVLLAGIGAPPADREGRPRPGVGG